MAEKTYKAAVGVRGDCLYCPLPLSIDSYWNCEAECYHCPFRRLNRTWGTDLRPADPDAVRRKLENGLKNSNPKSTLANALKNKMTIRIGSKSDPFQKAERTRHVTRRILEHLVDLEWSFVIQTRFLGNMIECSDILDVAHEKGLLTVMPIISPGREWDWEVLERKRTTPIPTRVGIIKSMLKKGWSVGVNGEPFIPGYHTVEMFADTLDWLKDMGIKSYNTYNLHLNDDVAKKLHSIDVDIEAIWTMNQDKNWRPIQKELCRLAVEKRMILGCPDFVNTGWGYTERTNTCCGVSVPNPSRFNSHHWKRMIQKGRTPKQAFEATWKGVGDPNVAKDILLRKSEGIFTIKDIVE